MRTRRFAHERRAHVALLLIGIQGAAEGPLGPPMVHAGHCTVVVAADYDNDCDVDPDDFMLFSACGSGPTVSVRAGCEAKDLDADGDVDHDDFGVFQRCLSGAGVLPVQSCAYLPIDSALEGACEGGSLPDPEVPAGPDLHKVTLHDPTAVCNDGSPAIMYVRRASAPASMGTWVFHLQGGSGCGTYEECLDRWCGFGSYSAGKMSSRWAPPSMRGDGILNRARTPLANANLVFLYYCSSDSWVGKNSTAYLSDPLNPAQGYSLAFRGHSILQVAFQRLLSGPMTSDDGEETVPALRTATRVLVTGTSAGAVGAEHNIDWIAALFDPTRTEVRAAFNAGATPLTGEFSPPANPADPTIEEQFDAELQARYATTYGPAGYDAFLDESCMAVLGGGPDEANCSYTTYVMFNHITTPFFTEADLRDPVTRAPFLGFGAAIADYAEAMRATLLQLPNIGTTGVEAADIHFTPGVFGPNCARHVWLTNDAWYFDATVEDEFGVTWNFDSALRNWLGGGNIFVVDQHPPAGSTCP